MADNFFTDNLDLQFHLGKLDLREVVEITEDGYRYSQIYPAAPRNYADAKDNYRLLLTVLGGICANDIAPHASDAAKEGAQLAQGRVVYPEPTREALDLLRKADLMGAMLPWEYGGLNMPETIFQMMVELTSRAEAGLMTIFGLQEISAAIAEFGDEEMKERVLPRFAQGELTGAMVLTEPDAGSDLGAVRTRAIYDEATEQWRINGVKRFITNGNADVLLVLARSEDGSVDARGLSLFLIERDDSVVVRRLENKMGIHVSPTCEVQFNNTPAQLVGRRRFGLIRYAMGLMNGARLAVAAQALGIAEAAYREAHKYAQQRVQFGKSIDNIPAVYRMLLSMRGEIEATRSLVYETSRWVDLLKAYELLKQRGDITSEQRQRQKQIDRLAGVLTPLVKYYSTEMGNRVCFQAMQVHGGAGYMREFNVERHFRDIRVTNIYEGTSQLQVVAATGGLLGHSLDGLLNDWAAQDYGPELAPLKRQMEEGTVLLNRSIDHLREQDDTALIDYYAVDLVDIATYVVNGWLTLQDARLAERKRELARVYIAESMPKIRWKVSALQAIDPAIPQAREIVLDQVL
jgi:alkylation response protein AidB-like acyl-CoA dehydrogenase